MDVWTGSDDKTLRKLQIDLGVEPESGRSGTASFSLELTGLNEPQTIEAPTNTRPIDELLAGLAPLLGGAMGAGTGGADTPSAGSLGDYQRCITDAGSDVAEAQKCAALLER